MTMLLAFIAAIALLVIFHELGHYWVARKCNVKVLRFSVGFGKVIYRKQFTDSGTEWVISAIPLGGYVKMVDEREEEVPAEDLKYAFNRKPVLQRIAIVVAGPLANFLLAIVLHWLMFMYGVQGLRPVLGDVPAGTPAAIAQLRSGDTIERIDGEHVPSWQELRWRLLDLSLKKSIVEIETRNSGAATSVHELNVGLLEAKDLDGEFLDKLGLHLKQPEILPVIGKLVDGDVAEQAGLLPGDRILSADGVTLKLWSDFVEVVRAHPGHMINLEVQRGDQLKSLAIVPASITDSGKTVGRIGAAPKVDENELKTMQVEVRYNPSDAMLKSLRKTWETSAISLTMLGKMVLGEVSIKNLSGPITIADYAGQSAAMGIAAYLGFLALISVSLGVLNLLPIPLLDGGHLLYYLVELLKGSPVSEQTWEIGQKIGIGLLGTLMVFAVYNDINRLVSG
jgi:regulator of sigma E protease